MQHWVQRLRRVWENIDHRITNQKISETRVPQELGSRKSWHFRFWESVRMEIIFIVKWTTFEKKNFPLKKNFLRKKIEKIRKFWNLEPNCGPIGGPHPHSLLNPAEGFAARFPYSVTNLNTRNHQFITTIHFFEKVTNFHHQSLQDPLPHHLWSHPLVVR